MEKGISSYVSAPLIQECNTLAYKSSSILWRMWLPSLRCFMMTALSTTSTDTHLVFSVWRTSSAKVYSFGGKEAWKENSDASLKILTLSVLVWQMRYISSAYKFLLVQTQFWWHHLMWWRVFVCCGGTLMHWHHEADEIYLISCFYCLDFPEYLMRTHQWR